MKKIAMCLGVAAGLAVAMPAFANDANVRSHKASIHKVKKAHPTTTGMGQAMDPKKRAMDDPRMYGKPDRH